MSDMVGNPEDRFSRSFDPNSEIIVISLTAVNKKNTVVLSFCGAIIVALILHEVQFAGDYMRILCSIQMLYVLIFDRRIMTKDRPPVHGFPVVLGKVKKRLSC